MKFICCDIFRTKVARVVLWETFIVHSIVNIVTIYFFIYYLNQEDIIQHAPAVLCVFYPMFGILVLLFNGELLEKSKYGLPRWSLDTTNEVIRQKIEKQVKLFTAYAILNFLISLIGGLTFIQNLSRDNELFFALRFFEEFVPSHSQLLSFLYKLHLPLLGYIMIVHSYHVIYYTQHQNFQLYMFQPFIENIPKEDEADEEESLFHNVNYQKKVQKRLIFCVERSRELISYKTQVNERIIYLIVGFSVLGALLGLGVIMYFFYGYIESTHYFRLSLITTGTVFVFSGLIWSGQSLEDNFQAMEALIKNITWYNFNKQNKIIYLIFLVNVTREKRETFSENNAINYELGLKVLRGVYSVMSVMLNVD